MDRKRIREKMNKLLHFNGERSTKISKSPWDKIMGGVLLSIAIALFLRVIWLYPNFFLSFVLAWTFLSAGIMFLVAAPFYNKSDRKPLIRKFLLTLGALYIFFWMYWLIISLGTFQIERHIDLWNVFSLSFPLFIVIISYLAHGGATTASKYLSKVFRTEGIKDIVISFLVFYPLTIFFFSLFNGTIYKFRPDSFYPSEGLSLFDFLYYSVVTITTLGYGDIRPLHWATRLLSMVEVIIGIGLIVVYVGITASVVLAEESKKRRK